ncbi:hypothetical protein [Cohnella sp. REN36]|uniref:hypothetical protein n=1 Tax=Cohnella sp. REN36 TaxID=2887347 RepID=UPI001D134065|nr:hypothetical protein [Cohnella sp. REN36]MCC3371766.1 hypothetical protein [Cohnella sp. REN36]
MGIVTNQFIFMLLSVVGGFLLMGQSKLVELAEGTQRLLAKLSESNGSVAHAVRSSAEYPIETDVFEVYPALDARYPLVVLDHEPYLRVKAFIKHVSQQGDEYKFRLPGMEPIVLRRSDAYFQGVELFAFEEQVLVMLRKLGCRAKVAGGKLMIDRLEDAAD